MELYPAIDLLGGRCVRLRQGDYDAVTVYGDDPVAVATSFAAAGATWIHIVDLDAARTGDPVNRSIIEAVSAAMGQRRVRVQTGGGVRTRESIDALRAAGVSRVVIGTAAVRDPALVDTATADWSDGIAVGLDFRLGTDGSRDVAVHGWTSGSGLDLLELVRRFEPSGAALIVTEIGRDGMLTGPDLEGLSAVLASTTSKVIASGGVSSLDDIVALDRLQVSGRSLAGVITGKAIYEGRFDVADACAALTTP
jgi:phosphoribosylformimino-5-aminoimidazole carboxamide ribotide isomerase